MSKPLEICIIIDERIGENSILHGILDKISIPPNTNVSYFKIEDTSRPKWLRNITSIFIKLGFMPKRFFSYYISKIGLEGELKNIDILICRNGQSSFLAQAYQTRYGRTFTICWHRPSGFPKSSKFFDVIIRYNKKSLKSDSTATSTIFETSPIFPVKINRKDMVISGVQFLKKNKLQSTGVTRWALFLGGNCTEYQYSESDIIDLTSSMKKLSVSLGIRWLITTSPRTPETWPNIITNSLGEHIDYLVDYQTTPESVVPSYLEICDVVCATEDSATMVCECIAAAKKTIVITTKENQKNFNPNGYYGQIVNSLVEENYVQHCMFNDLHTTNQHDFNSCDIYDIRMGELEQILTKKYLTYTSLKNK